MKKNILKFLSVAMVAALCLTMSAVAFAANATGTQQNPATATIVKELQIPGGTTTPTASFSFTLASESVDAPVIADKTVSFTAEDHATGTGDVLKVYKTADLFSAVVWPHAGEYVYTVKETANTYAAGADETLTYSHAEYKLTVVVVNGENDGELYIKEIAAQLMKNDAGETVTDGKVDPNPTEDEQGNPSVGGIRFVNTYVKGKNVNPDDKNPEDGMMRIEKVVGGDIGDKKTPYAFSVSAVNPSIVPAADKTVKARVFDKATNTYGEEIVISENTEVKLAHNQTLVFMNLYAGATVSFKETDATAIAKYEVSASVMNGHAAENTYNKTAVTETGITVSPLFEDKAVATVTNTLNYQNPTGVIIDNLPYVLLIAVALIGLAAYLIVRRRASQN